MLHLVQDDSVLLPSASPRYPSAIRQVNRHACHRVQVEQEIQALMALLPGLEMRFDRMKADLLLRLLSRRDEVAHNMLALRRELPDADIAAMVARYPALVADFTPEQLVDRIAAVRCAAALPPQPRRHLTRTPAVSRM